jgi:hypothetical protein
MTMTMTWGGPAGAAETAGAEDPAGAGLTGGRLGTTADAVALEGDGDGDGDGDGAALPHPTTARSRTTADSGARWCIR